IAYRIAFLRKRQRKHRVDGLWLRPLPASTRRGGLKGPMRRWHAESPVSPTLQERGWIVWLDPVWPSRFRDYSEGLDRLDSKQHWRRPTLDPLRFPVFG